MSAVGLIETVAWLISIGLGGWMLIDMTRVARRHGETSLVDAADPLDEPAVSAPEPDRAAGPERKRSA